MWKGRMSMDSGIDGMQRDGCRRRVLMIAHAFPPTGGPGVQRPAKFAKYIPKFGWRPLVWTVSEVAGLPRDPTLMYDLPREVEIHTCSPGGGIQAVRRSLEGLVGGGARSGLSGAASRFAAAIDWRLQAWVAAASFPDDCVAWARRSIRPLVSLIDNRRIDLIFSTFSPASNHLLALELKRRTHKPWVADFRDLWTDDCRYREPSPKHRAGHRQLEQEILETADAVIGVTPRQTEILADHTPDQRQKYFTITNGFDPADFVEPEPERSSGDDRFVLTYTGRFDLIRTSDAVFDGLRHFVEGLGADRDRFLLRIVGYANATAREKVQATGVAAQFIGYVSHAEAIRVMRASDALLLTAPDGRHGDSVIRAKVFEYLASRRPILVVGPPGGQCERIVDSCEAGLCVSFDPSAISIALSRLFEAWRSGRPHTGCQARSLGRYSRVSLARKLAAVFDEIVAAGPVSGRRGRAGDLALAACAP